MILILGGTAESRIVAGWLMESGQPFLLSVVTEHGRSLAADVPDRNIRVGALDREGLVRLIKEHAIQIVLDCTHPFAETVSQNAIDACARAGIRYIRYEREAVAGNRANGAIGVRSFAEAADRVKEYEGTVLLAVGVKPLSWFEQCRSEKRKLLARVLPLPESIDRCRAAGFAAEEIIDSTGVQEVEENEAQFAALGIHLLVTKESGLEGGTDTKLTAAANLNIPVILIERPTVNYPQICRDLPGLARASGIQMPF